MAITEPDDLPKAECELGYPHTQLERIFDEQQMRRLRLWMAGQTQAICEGKRWDEQLGKYVPTLCGPHGVVMYGHDVRRWLVAGRILD